MAASAAGRAAMLGLRGRVSGPLRPPPAPTAALHRPSEAALRRLLEAGRARLPPRPPAPPGDAALQALLASPLFRQPPPARFARSLAAWLPREADGLSPATVALLAAYLARHRLRQPPLLDAVAAFLLRGARQLDPKVLQKLVLPFSRTNYRPPNHAELFAQLEAALAPKAAAAPLATVNILLSLVQLRHCPAALLPRVFAPAFLDKVTSSPCGFIMRRYLSLLDVAVALEAREYDGPRLDPRYRVCMFDGALTADEANRKYSYKGLVAEALRQLVGEEGYRQNEVVPPGYCADFLLQIAHSGSILPWTSQAVAPLEAPDVQTLTWDTLGGSLSRQQWLGSPLTGRLPWPDGSPHLLAPQGHSCSPREEPCPGTSVLSSSLVGAPCSTPEAAPHYSSPTLGTEPQQHPPKERRLLPTALDGMEKAEEIHRIVLSVNDKWHYCHSSAVLVGSRAMRNRHLRLLGYHLVQLPYMDLERVSGVEEAKQYLCQKLRRQLHAQA